MKATNRLCVLHKISEITTTHTPTTLNRVREVLHDGLHHGVVRLEELTLPLIFATRVDLNQEGRPVDAVQALVVELDIQTPLHILRLIDSSTHVQ